MAGFLVALEPWVSLILFLHGILFIVFLAKPLWAVYILVFVIPLSTTNLFIENPKLATLIAGGNQDVLPIYILIVMIAGSSIFISNRARRHLPSISDYHLLIPVFFLLLFALAVLFTSPDTLHSMFHYIVLLVNCIIFYIFISAVKTSDDIIKVAWCVIMSGTFQSILGLILFLLENDVIRYSIDLAWGFLLDFKIYTGPLLESELFRRLSSTLSSHQLALLLAASIPIAIGLLMHEKTKLRYIVILCISIMLVTEVMTLSRGGIIALYFSSLFVFILSSKLRPRFVFLSFFFLTGIIFLVYATNIVGNITLGTDIEPRLVKRTTAGEANITSQAPLRIQLWKESFHDLRKTVFLGMGVGNMKLFEAAPHAHSIYFSLILDFGIMGVVFLIWFGTYFLHRLFSLPWVQETQSETMYVVSTAALIAVLIQGLVDFGYNLPILWLFFGYFVAISNFMNKEKSNIKSAVLNIGNKKNSQCMSAPGN